jgi:hypothetical protein
MKECDKIAKTKVEDTTEAFKLVQRCNCKICSVVWNAEYRFWAQQHLILSRRISLTASGEYECSVEEFDEMMHDLWAAHRFIWVTNVTPLQNWYVKILKGPNNTPQIYTFSECQEKALSGAESDSCKMLFELRKPDTTKEYFGRSIEHAKKYRRPASLYFDTSSKDVAETPAPPDKKQKTV